MLAALVLALAAPLARRPVIPEDTYRIRTISGVEVSPDGKTLAVTIERADEKEDAFRHEVLLTDADGRNPRPLCREDVECTDPKFSPDGTKLAWLSDEKGATQIWVVKLPGRRGKPVTTGSDPAEFDWSPDATRIVYTRLDGYVKRPAPGAPQPAAGAARGGTKDRRPEEDESSPYVITRTQIQRDGEGYMDDRRSHLWVVGADGGTARRITDGPYDDEQPRWSPKGNAIAFVSNRSADPDASDDSDILVVAPAGGTARKIGSTPGPDTDPSWSHAGDRLAFVSSPRANDFYQGTHVMVVPAAGGASLDLTASLDTCVASDDLVGGREESARLLWSQDDASLVTDFARRGASTVARIPSGGGVPAELLGGAQQYGLVRIASATGRLYWTRSTPTVVSELWTSAFDGSARRMIHDPNSGIVSNLTLVTPEKIVAKNRAGDDVEAWLYPPPVREPGRTYPMIVYVHGGPQEYDGEFFDTGLENQLFPGKGWAVLRVNYRGSLSYGEAFCAAPRGDWHAREYEDLMAAVDAALFGHPWLDGGRLGIGGWSYGGIMTVWTVAHTDRFKVGVPERFEIDYLSSFGEDQWHVQYATELGDPYEKAELYRRLSPGTYVPNIKTPLFLIADEKDGNCPPTQAMQLYQRLKLRGIPSELVIYPGEPHTMTVPSHYVDRLYRLVDWFGRYLGGS
jgi:dipeptidyl aminopeptidase/acylaminoacyl peptidase